VGSRGFFVVAVALVIMHLLAGVEYLVGRHGALTAQFLPR
jgi:hypothetical protein